MEHDLNKSLDGFNLNYLRDYNSNPKFDTILPPSNQNDSLIIMASIVDSLGGIKNITKDI